MAPINKHYDMARRRVNWLTVVAVLAAVLCVLLWARGAASQENGNADRGKALARTACAECHAIEPGEQRSPKPDAPTFERIAATPGMTSTALEVFMQSPHLTMPNLIIKRDDRADLSAYILSLRRSK